MSFEKEFPHVWEVLTSQLGWLEARCQREATLRPGLDAEDLFQAVLSEFIQQAREGFFDQAAYKSFEAQVRTLLAQCLLHQRTAAWRKDRISRAEVAHQEGDEEAEPLDKLPSPSTPSADQLQLALDAPKVLAAVRGMENPARRLLLLALYFPDLLTREDLEAAARFRRGGGEAVRRPVALAWKLFQQHRGRSALVMDETRWKETVTEILRFDGPLGSAPRPQLLRAINTVEKQVARAREELAGLVGDRGGGE
jgi:hypothetical protein